MKFIKMSAKPTRWRTKKGQGKKDDNPWAYQDNLQPLSESGKHKRQCFITKLQGTWWNKLPIS